MTQFFFFFSYTVISISYLQIQTLCIQMISTLEYLRNIFHVIRSNQNFWCPLVPTALHPHGFCIVFHFHRMVSCSHLSRLENVGVILDSSHSLTIYVQFSPCLNCITFKICPESKGCYHYYTIPNHHRLSHRILNGPLTSLPGTRSLSTVNYQHFMI